MNGGGFAAPAAPAAVAEGAGAFKLAYEEPFWSGKDASSTWALDVVRAGVELEPIPLNAKACYLVGRVPVCDIVLENDTVSRQHAVFQSRSNGKLYLFDLDSTHGTFVNGKRLEPRTYAELTAGCHIKFGSTARIHILTGTGKADVQEPEQSKEAPAVVVAPKLSKRRQKEEEFFEGNVEDGEKFVKRKEHEKRQKERSTQMKKQKKKEKQRGARDEFEDDDQDEADDGAKPKNGPDSDDSDAPENAGEADPDKLVVGAARSNWDDYEVDAENDDFYDRASKKRALVNEGGSTARAMSRDEIVNAKVELDLQIRDLLAQIDAGKRASSASVAQEDEDELDAYMKVVANTSVGENVQKMMDKKSELEKQHRKLDKMLEATMTALDRLKPRDEAKKDTLQSRVAAVLDAGFAKPELMAAAVVAAPEVVAAPAVAVPSPVVHAVAKPKQNSTVAALAEFAKRESKKAKVERCEVVSIVARDPDLEDVEWAPPKNQSGDGTTDLNKRLGY